MPRFLLCCLLACGLAAASNPQALITTNHGPITVELFADQAPETVANFLGLATGSTTWTDPQTNTEQNAPFYDGLTFHRVIDGFMIQGGCPLGTGTGGPGYRFADEINASSLGLDQEQVFRNGQPNPQYMRELQQLIVPKMQAEGLLTPQANQQELMAEFQKRAQEYEGWSIKRLFEEIGYRYRADLPASSKPLRGYLAMANSGPNSNGSQFFINLVDTPHLIGKHTVFGKVVDGMSVVEAIGQVAVDTQNNKPKEAVVIESIRPLTE